MNAKSSTKSFLYRTAAAIVIVMLALAALPVTPAYAATCTTITTGNWNAAGTWGGCTGPGGIPGLTDDVVIEIG